MRSPRLRRGGGSPPRPVERLADATCVNCFFQSTKTLSTGEAIVKRGSMNVVGKGSTWDILLDGLGTPLGDGKWKEVVKPRGVQQPVKREMGAVCFQKLLEGVSTKFALPASQTVQEVPRDSEALNQWCFPGAKSSGGLSSHSYRSGRGDFSPANLNHHLPYYSLCLFLYNIYDLICDM